MSKPSKDAQYLAHIIDLCESVIAARKRFGDSYEIFAVDRAEKLIGLKMLQLRITCNINETD